MSRDDWRGTTGQPASGVTPDRWPEVNRAVDAALELPPEERAAFIDRACVADTELRRQVERLLAACERVERSGTFLATSGPAFAAPVIADLSAQAERAEAETPAAFAALAAALAGRYTIERELGRGGMARVYLARDERHARQVAIKVLSPDLARELGLERFLREIDIAARLRHPHIVPLHDSGEAAGLLYYVMPFIDGESLRERLAREGQLPLNAAIAIARDVAEALDYAHAHGVVHRDIKPANVLLEQSDALVADFGVARAIAAAGSDRLTGSGIVVGTPTYMSPEQAAGEARSDGRSDVYALGCVVYEMFAGEPPYAGPSAQAVLAKHMQAPVPDIRVVRPTIGEETQRVLAKALAKVPADRFASAGEFARALQASAARQDVARGQRAQFGIAAGVVAALAVAGALLVRVTGGFPRVRGEATEARATLDPKRIAVLYFDDLTPGRTLTHVANGLTEDLIDELSQVRALHVISPNGVKPYQGRSPPVDSLARALGVGTIVSGSLASSGQRLRVTVRLVDARSGQQLQSRTLEQPSQDLFALQDTLTEQVALFLRERLGREIRRREQRAGTRSVRAWEMVQRAEELARQGAASIRAGEDRAAVEQLLRADTLFRAAEHLDSSWIAPTLGRGWVARSLAFVSPGPGGGGNSSGAAESPSLGPGETSVPWMLRGIEHAESVLERRPGDAEALALRGDLRYRLVVLGSPTYADNLLPLAEDDLFRAVQTRPDLARAWYSLGDLYWRQARFTESAHALRNAYDADAFLTEMRSVITVLFFASLNTGRFEDARSWCRTGTARYPEDPRFAECELTLLGWSARGRRQVAAAWRQVAEIERRDTAGVLSATWAYRRMMVAAVLARTGMRDSARAVVGRTRAELSKPSNSADDLLEAYVRVLLEEPEEVLRLLTAYLRAVPHDRALVARTPWFRELHTDPRFRALLRSSS
jgi:eukaryotic-like serine/threonine-protein kinase